MIGWVGGWVINSWLQLSRITPKLSEAGAGEEKLSGSKFQECYSVCPCMYVPGQEKREDHWPLVWEVSVVS